MKLQWLRSKTGKIIGIALSRRGIVLDNPAVAPRAYVSRPERICDMCNSVPAVVFCFGHVEYVCAGCLAFHSDMTRCNFVSITGFGKFADRLAKEATSDLII